MILLIADFNNLIYFASLLQSNINLLNTYPPPISLIVRYLQGFQQTLKSVHSPVSTIFIIISSALVLLTTQVAAQCPRLLLPCPDSVDQLQNNNPLYILPSLDTPTTNIQHYLVHYKSPRRIPLFLPRCRKSRLPLQALFIKSFMTLASFLLGTNLLPLVPKNILHLLGLIISMDQSNMFPPLMWWSRNLHGRRNEKPWSDTKSNASTGMNTTSTKQKKKKRQHYCIVRGDRSAKASHEVKVHITE